MANLNKVMLIGRLTRDPETRTFANGGKVAKIGFAVNNRKKNQSTGAWEEVPVFLDVKAFNRETGRKMADLVEQYLKKGSQVYIEGHLLMEEWEDKNGGGKRSKLVIVMDDLQFLDTRQNAEGGARPARASGSFRQQSEPAGDSYQDEPGMESAPVAGGNEDIPF